MAPEDTVIATWNGPFPAETAPGQPPVEVGDEIEVPLAQAYGGHYLVNGEPLIAPDAAEPDAADTPAAGDDTKTPDTDAFTVTGDKAKDLGEEPI